MYTIFSRAMNFMFLNLRYLKTICEWNVKFCVGGHLVDERFGHGCIPLLNCMVPHPPTYVNNHK